MSMKIKKVNLEKIKKLRKKSGLSVEDVSRDLGYKTVNGYYYLETGRNKFSAENLAMVAEILGVSISALFFEENLAKMAIVEGAEQND